MTATTDPRAPEATFPLRRPCPFSLPAEYAGVREHDRVRPATLADGTRVWLVARHEDVLRVLTHPAVSADRSRPGFPFLTPESRYLASVPVFVGMDGDDHARRRRMFLSSFTGRRVRELRPVIEADVDARLDRMVAHGGPVDLVESLALPVPAAAMASILGVPADRRARFEELTVSLLTRETRQTGTAGEVFADLVAFVKDLVRTAAESTTTTDDMIGRVVGDHVRTGAIDVRELTITVILILLAGYETTANTIALGVANLLATDGAWESLEDDPDRVPAAVEEMLRHGSVAELASLRVAVEDVEIGGVVIPAGEGIVPLGAAANRDPRVFDDPERFDATRSARGHVAFGYGAHACIGAALARLEIEIVLTRLITRLPGLRLAVPTDEIGVKYDAVLFGPDLLPVHW